MSTGRSGGFDEPELLERDNGTVDPGCDAINGNYLIAKNGEDATFKPGD